MRYLDFLYPALLAFSSFISAGEALRSGQKVKLSRVQSLTLRSGLKTSHRRVDPLPQLKCVGGSAKGLYDVDVMRCRNMGFDYNEEDIQWTCTASLPEEFKLGSTDVICEGYDSPDDPYILKGSCGVEYRLLLTEKGEKKYGGYRPPYGDGNREGHPATFGEKAAAAVFWLLFIGVGLWIAYNAFKNWANRNGAAGGAGGRPGWGGGGGGGGWGGDDNDDPPPPYDWRPGTKPRSNYQQQPQGQGWRPGFWSGALGGAAAGYAAGRAGNRNNTQNYGSTYGGGNGGSSWWNNGEGSSRSSSGSSGSSFSARHESTGFGSTSRR